MIDVHGTGSTHNRTLLKTTSFLSYLCSGPVVSHLHFLCLGEDEWVRRWGRGRSRSCFLCILLTMGISMGPQTSGLYPWGLIVVLNTVITP